MCNALAAPFSYTVKQMCCAVIMAVRLFFFAPHSSSRVLQHTLAPPSGGALCWPFLCCALCALTTALASFGVHFVLHEGVAQEDSKDSHANTPNAADGGVGQLGIMFFKGLDWSVPTFVVMMMIVGGGAALARDQKQHVMGVRRSNACSMSPFGPALVLLALFHSFIVTPLGLQDLGGPNMYSNLRMQSGSNHLLLPTALLQRWCGKSSADWCAFAGGIVRIESSTSVYLNSLYPGEITSVHSKRARRMLMHVGHSARQFNPAMGIVLGSTVTSSILYLRLSLIFLCV